ncbi:polyprenyl synthetase family protein [Pendulispora rubella]|uniref:Polyprenyl synthetase family protein n=1 Tax=Pendulispora rubella TaxID=2741070 RepID=A0ABZ2L4X3_9BACT
MAHDQQAFKARIDRALDDFAREETSKLIAIDEDLAPMATQLRSAVSGGKRLRAAFCYWGWRAAGQDDSEEMIRAAAAVELVHAAAIVHDDIIDESPTRRGLPTVHVAFEATVAGAGRRAKRHALGLAMLVGDLLMAWAGQLFTSCGLPSAFLARTQSLWPVMSRELVAGECLEILSTARPPRMDRVLDIVRLKTAKYTVERPLHIGGVLGGASKALLSAFTAYAIPLGEAFQLRDDLLGVFGSPTSTGKSNQDDLIGYKPTSVLAIALSMAHPVDREELEILLGRGVLDLEQLDRVREIMQRSGARQHVESMIEERAAAAVRTIERTRLPSDASSALQSLVSAVVTRES